MKWILKAIIQKFISWLPYSQRVNFLFQKYVTRGVRLSDQYFSDKYISAVDHIKYFNQHSKSDSYKVLELGSGWYPVVPIALFLSGAESVLSIDISALMKREGILLTIKKYVQWYEEGKLEDLKPFIQQDRFEKLNSLANSDKDMPGLLSELKLTLKVQDARNTGENENSFDLICSNNTFEHIYPNILQPILSEFQRILKPSGLMSHFIDMSDHFAHLDSSITIYNFLKYSKKGWAFIDNNVQPQNRWRLKDYEDLYASLSIKVIDKSIRPGNVNEVESIKLHSDFDSYSTEEIAISHAYMVSSK